MENLSDGGLWARWRRLGRTTPATVEADVEFHRGPAPARFAVAGFIALAISILSVVFVVYRIHEISDRSVRVQATVLGGVRNVNTGTTDLEFMILGIAAQKGVLDVQEIEAAPNRGAGAR